MFSVAVMHYINCNVFYALNIVVVKFMLCLLRNSACIWIKSEIRVLCVRHAVVGCALVRGMMVMVVVPVLTQMNHHYQHSSRRRIHVAQRAGNGCWRRAFSDNVLCSVVL